MSDVEPLLPPVPDVRRPVDRRARRALAAPAREARGDRRRRVGRAVGLGLGTVLAVVVLGGLWIGSRVAGAVGALLDARPAMEDLATSLREGPTPTVLESALEVRGAVGRAHRNVGDPVWRAAEVLPGVGDRLHAVRAAVTAADVLAQDALDPIVSLVGSVSFGPYPERGEGYAALVEAKELSDDLAAIADALTRAHAELADVRTTDLFVPAVSEPFGDALATIEEASEVASVLLPGVDAMLSLSGYTGETTSLVVVLDDRQPRALGGAIEAAYAVTTEFGAIRDVERVDAAALAAGSAAEASPSVPGAAERLRAAGEALTGAPPDAVLLLTPAGVDRLWRLDPSPDVEGLAAVLPSMAALAAADPVTRDMAIDTATVAAIRSVLGLTPRADELALALRDAVAAGELRVWFADTRLQEALVGTRAAGALPAAVVGGVPVTVALHAQGPGTAAVAEVRAGARSCGPVWARHPAAVLEVTLTEVPTPPVAPDVPDVGQAPEADAPVGAVDNVTTLLVGLPDALGVTVVDGTGAPLPWSDEEVDGHRLVRVVADGAQVVRVELTGRAGSPSRLLVTSLGGVPGAIDGAAPPRC